MELVTVIVDECGTVRYYRADLTIDQEMEILSNHPEWSIRCMEV